jgi:hypothetical protein
MTVDCRRKGAFGASDFLQNAHFVKSVDPRSQESKGVAAEMLARSAGEM